MFHSTNKSLNRARREWTQGDRQRAQVALNSMAYASKTLPLKDIPKPPAPVMPPIPSNYKTYIKSAYWRAFRISILAQRGSMCEDCGDHRHQVQVHHLNYMRLMCELPSDVRVLCDPCHRKRHNRV